MNKNKPFVNLTRLIIETTAPMAIHSGGREIGFDNQLARDANNLPYIPATTIAGVWRHLLRATESEELSKKWFGHNDAEKQHASILQISNGEIHDSKNQPQNGLIATATIEKDGLLSLLSQEKPHKREHVRINDIGSAVDKGKFDRILLPTGVRFTIDIRWDNTQSLVEDEMKNEWREKLLTCWSHPHFAFGSSTRNGLGRFKIIKCYDQNIELYKENKTETVKLLKGFNDKSINPKVVKLKEVTDNIPIIDISLQAESAWRCGSGEFLLDASKSNNSPKILSYSERIIQWQEDKNTNTSYGKLSKNPIPIVCGSSIKGIIAHRMTFHYNRFQNFWASDENKELNNKQTTWEKRPNEIDALFGEKGDGELNPGKAGNLVFLDAIIQEVKIIHRSHNQINRFTSGVMPQALYSEELLYQPQFSVKAYLLNDKDELSEALKKALAATIEDMKTGRLSIGAGTGRGTSITKSMEKQQ